MAELKFTDKNFREEVLLSDQPVLVDFWAAWCGPCKMMGPVITQLANKYEGKVKIGKVNVDEEPGLAQTYGVMSIPTIVLIKNGEVVKKVVGAVPKAEVEAMLL